MEAGSREAIKYELQHGTIWTVIDELLHSLDHIWARLPMLDSWLYRYCQWAHRAEIEAIQREPEN